MIIEIDSAELEKKEQRILELALEVKRLDEGWQGANNKVLELQIKLVGVNSELETAEQRIAVLTRENQKQTSEELARLRKLLDREIELKEEIKKYRELLHTAGHAWRDTWAIDWEPICEVMAQVDKEKASE